MAGKSKDKKKKQGASLLQNLLAALVIAVACAGITHLLTFFDFTSRAELMSLDLRFQTRKPIDLYPNLGYVNLDNESCELAGSWPWPRSYHVALVKALDFYGAKSAGYDVFYSEPSPQFVQRPIPALDGLDEDTALELLGDSFQNHDENFRQALEETDLIYLGQFLVGPEQLGLDKDPPSDVLDKFVDDRISNFKPIKIESIEVAKNDAFPSTPELNERLDRTAEISPPIPSLGKASQGIGFEQIVPDNITGTVYQYPMFLEFDHQVYPALGLLMAADLLGIDLDKAVIKPGEYVEVEVTKPHGRILAGKMKIPVNDKVRSLMNWSAPYFKTYFHINFRQLSYYHAVQQIKAKVMEKISEVESLEALARNLHLWSQRENWAPKEELLEIILNTIAAQLISDHALKPREELIASLKQQTLFAKVHVDRVVDSVRLSQHLIDHATDEDRQGVADNISHHDYLNFRPALLKFEDYPSLDQNHAKEIARNVLWFQHQDRLDEVAPFYFPPCFHSHVDGTTKDISPTMLQGKVLMIGLEGEGTIDLNPQPYEESCAMVALHANAINSFLTGQFLTFPSLWQTYLNLIMLCILIAILAQLMDTRWSFGAYILAFLGFSAYTWHEFSEAGHHLHWVIPVLGLTLSYLISIGLKLYIAFREKQKMKGMFGKMVSPDVLKVMTDHPDQFSLTGSRMSCTSYFSSMENFSKIMKGVTPEEMTGLLGSYLTPASQIITSYKGYIDKYEGHIIMADYGVPIPTGDHRLQCLYASIETQIDITAFKHHIYARTGKHVNTSMGVNTGFVSAGNMGSDKKMQYTIMGDTVNTAARFRPANWIYDYLGSIIIGESTYPYVKDIIQTRQLDRLLLKGKLKPVNIYQVLGWDPETYLKTRGKEDVTETLQVIWADHCPPEKIYGYQLLWEEQFKRTQHPLCQELATFFANHIGDAAELARITLCKEIQNNGHHHIELQQRVKDLSGQELAPIPDGNWQEKLHAWDKDVRHNMELLSQRETSPDLDKLKRDLLDVHEKIEALIERLEDDISLPKELEHAWDQIKSYVETRFENDEQDYHELYMERYEVYQKAASELVHSVSQRMSEYHTMMSQVGAMTEQQKRGCETYLKALELHWERKWDESIAMFQRVLEDLPGDKAALSFIQRIEGYKTSPPPSTWQGEFAQTKK